ncbi:MAG: metal ABC transporter substrate-binding protein [Pseudomonadota bacterium]
MPNRRTFLITVLAASLMPMASMAQDKLPVVASFSILGDMVKRVGGDRVAVTTLVGPDGDAHVFQPTPADARAVSNAEILFVNGLGFEGWIDRLIDASGYLGPIVVATSAISPLSTEDAHDEHEDDEHEEHAHEDHADHDHGDLDPHAWQSLANAKLYVATIAHALSDLDPEGADTYTANRDAYLSDIDALEIEVRQAIESFPKDQLKIVTSHDAFGYFTRDYGLEFIAPQGVSTESEASAAEVAALIRQIRDEKIAAVFVENITDERLLRQIADETDASVGGTLYSGALSGPEGPAPTYLDMMRHNIRTLASALSS